MSRVKSVIELASAALALAIVIGIAVGPETVSKRIDEALAASWRTVGDHLANRELAAIASQLDRERHDFERIGALHNELDASLQSLRVRRRCVAARLDEKPPPAKGSSQRELAHVDAAIALLRSAVARADSVLDEERDSLGEREAALSASEGGSRCKPR